MTRAFTQYWSEPTARQELQVAEGVPVRVTGSDQFASKGLEAGDVLYLLSMRKGQMVVLSRGVVEVVLGHEEACVYLQTDDLWDSSAHVILQDGLPLLSRLVPQDLTAELRFLTNGNRESSLKYRENGQLDGQTLRSIRQLTPASATMLDQFLGLDGGPGEWEAGRELDSARKNTEPFEPENIQDGRARVMRAIVQRQGQGSFRLSVLEAYDGRCCVTGCEVESVLEAAHIMPYKGVETNHVQNGLLLRADIHTLFDLDLLGFEDYRVVVSEALVGTEYEALDGKHLLLPVSQDHWPHKEALAAQRARVAAISRLTRA